MLEVAISAVSLALMVVALSFGTIGRLKERNDFLLKHLSIEQGRTMEIQKQLSEAKRRTEEVRFTFAKYRDEVEGTSTIPMAISPSNKVAQIHPTRRRK